MSVDMEYDFFFLPLNNDTTFFFRDDDELYEDERNIFIQP